MSLFKSAIFQICICSTFDCSKNDCQIWLFNIGFFNIGFCKHSFCQNWLFFFQISCIKKEIEVVSPASSKNELIELTFSDPSFDYKAIINDLKIDLIGRDYDVEILDKGCFIYVKATKIK